jgi:hypothetical protein
MPVIGIFQYRFFKFVQAVKRNLLHQSNVNLLGFERMHDKILKEFIFTDQRLFPNVFT